MDISRVYTSVTIAKSNASEGLASEVITAIVKSKFNLFNISYYRRSRIAVI